MRTSESQLGRRSGRSPVVSFCSVSKAVLEFSQSVAGDGVAGSISKSIGGTLASGSTRVSGWTIRQGFARSSRAVCLEGSIVKSELGELGEVEDVGDA